MRGFWLGLLACSFLDSEAASSTSDVKHLMAEQEQFYDCSEDIFCKDEAPVAFLLATASYALKDDTQHLPLGSTLVYGDGSKGNVWKLVDHKRGKHIGGMQLWQNADRLCALAFKGTSAILEWIANDFDRALVHFRDDPADPLHKVQVARGFKNYLTKLDALKTFSSWDGKHGCNRERLIVSGHSLGAAAADLFSWWTDALGARSHTYGFGLPLNYVSYEDSKLVNAVHPKLWSFTNISRRSGRTKSKMSFTDLVTALNVGRAVHHRTLAHGLFHGHDAGTGKPAFVEVTNVPTGGCSASLELFCFSSPYGHMTAYYMKSMRWHFGDFKFAIYHTSGKEYDIFEGAEVDPKWVTKGTEPNPDFFWTNCMCRPDGVGEGDKRPMWWDKRASLMDMLDELSPTDAEHVAAAFKKLDIRRTATSAVGENQCGDSKAEL